jgi:hypothetical protein
MSAPAVRMSSMTKADDKVERRKGPQSSRWAGCQWLGLSMNMAAGVVAAQVGSGYDGKLRDQEGDGNRVKTTLKKSVGID